MFRKLAIHESVLSEHDIQTNIHLSFICGVVFSQEIAVVNSVVNMSQLTTLIVIFYVQKGTLIYILLFLNLEPVMFIDNVNIGF